MIMYLVARSNIYIHKKMKNSLGNLQAVLVLMLMMMMMMLIGAENAIVVGVILDMGSMVGKTTQICISMAIQDFHANSTTIIQPHFRDSKGDNLQAASAAIELLQNGQVMAILGPQQSSQAAFVIDLANKSKVLVQSPATTPSLSPYQYPYFLHTAPSSSIQAQPIAALLKSFGWREAVFVYEDTDFGRGPIPYLSDAMINISAQIKYHALLSPSSSDASILLQLHKLKAMHTRIFVVHISPALASRFFMKANQAGMMARGYAWIITDTLTTLLHYLQPQDIDSMQGVLGVKPYIPPSKRLTSFQRRWRRRFQSEYPDIVDRVELDAFGIWSYDSVFALATALQLAQSKPNAIFKRQTDLDATGTSRLLPMIRNIRLKGLSGDFQVVNGQLQTSAYQIVNVIGKGEKEIGFWNSRNGISSYSYFKRSANYTTNKDDLGAIIWPGDTVDIPKGWEIATGDDDKYLRVGVPANGGFVEFIKAYIDPKTKEVNAKGFCIDVFLAVLEAMPYHVPYKYVPFEKDDGETSGDYNDLVYQIVLEKFDMVVGDVTILYNRSKYVDFTLPYSEAGISMLVPAKVDDRKTAWIFMRPLETELWITTATFFIYTGFVVWVLEHRVNKEFRGPPHRQLGMIFWFSFSTIVFAHKEKMTSNLSRFVVLVWIFVVLVLTSSYTASLASMLTVQQLRPTVTDISQLLKRGESVGYQDGSFIVDMLKGMGFEDDKLKKYSSSQEYANALSNGSRNNGVSAIVDEVAYLKLLQAGNCNKYLIVGPTYKTAGFGFAFPKGSPLVADFSRAILQVTEGQMRNISNKWFGNESMDCQKQKGGDVEPFGKLTLESFKGLFLIAGSSSTCALVIFLMRFLYENKGILKSEGSMRQKLGAIVRTFDEEKDESMVGGRSINNYDTKGNMSPATSYYDEGEGVFSGDQPAGSPIHKIAI